MNILNIQNNSKISIVIFHMKTFQTPLGEIKVTHICHASILIQINGKNIYVDPSTGFNKELNITKYPKADLLCITHDHFDHLDTKFITHIRKPKTFLITSQTCTEKLNNVNAVLGYGQSAEWENIKIEAVPAYNIKQMRSPGHPFHPKGFGNGYIFNFGTFRLYVSGDTEIIPEMKTFGNIDVAFLPLMLPYTMDENQLVHAAKDINPKFLFVYHYKEVDKASLKAKLPGIEII